MKIGHLSSTDIVRPADTPASRMWYTVDANKKREQAVAMPRRCDMTNLDEYSREAGRSKLMRRIISVVVAVAAAALVCMLIWQRRSCCCATDENMET